MGEFHKMLNNRNPSPTPCDKGPGRAIDAGRVHEVLRFFAGFIRDRTAYYLVSNVLCPLEKSSKLSYAEIVGSVAVQWFVSHFWGTPFVHFCQTIRKHAQSRV